MRVLGISSSPRERGNSDLLLREALRGAESAGARAEYVALRDLTVGPCIACYACARTGRCCLQDDFAAVLDRVLEADRIIFGTPVFFMAVCAQGKLLIDRCQCLWAQKCLLKQPLFADGPRDRRALVIAVGGSRSRKMFDGIRMTLRAWFAVLEVRGMADLFVNEVDAKGDVLKHPQAMAEAFRLGAELARADLPAPQKPQTVELFGPPASSRPLGETDGR